MNNFEMLEVYVSDCYTEEIEFVFDGTYEECKQFCEHYKKEYLRPSQWIEAFPWDDCSNKVLYYDYCS